MPDYIYGSSLRAAKSKANYLFEGDFRRRPSQNLSGASRSVARVELLQQAVEQRQSREDCRKREQFSIKIQSTWRGYQCRRKMGQQMRVTFDKVIGGLANIDNIREGGLSQDDRLDRLIGEFLILFHSERDSGRFDSLLDLLLVHDQVVLEFRAKAPKIWLHRLRVLLKLTLSQMHLYSLPTDSRNFRFLERFTRPDEVFSQTESNDIWHLLINQNFYSVMRSLVDNSESSQLDQSSDDSFSKILKLMNRSLDLDPETDTTTSRSTLPPVCAFYLQFLKGPLSQKMLTDYLPRLLKTKPRRLDPRHVVLEFQRILPHLENLDNYGHSKIKSASVDSTNHDLEQSIWLCYSFVTSIYNRLDRMTDLDKTKYVTTLSKLISPAEYITNISYITAVNSGEFQSENASDDQSTVVLASQSTSNFKDIHVVIKKLIELINHRSHIDSLKSIIFNPELQSTIQSSIVRVCNLMLAHEHLAIFNCRLLYTVAFSKEFSRSLWRSITTSASTSLFEANIPIYQLIACGENVDQDSWKLILPKLRLFCSLCSYLIPTLDDAEFYADSEESSLSFVDNQPFNSSSNSLGQEAHQHGSFLGGKDLVNVSAILRDICVGMVEVLYQGSRNLIQQPALHLELNSDFSRNRDVQSRLLSFEKKVCFKALVRLVCQLHAKDSRKQYCPDGHWICPSVIIPANKAVDFELVTSQQGRILNQMTKDEQTQDHSSTTPSEIKTVLILQEIPFVISFHDRVQIFHQLLRKEKLIHQTDNYHFALPGSAILVQIRRNYIYEDAFERLSMENEPNLKLPLKVSLINALGAVEAGIDGGGLSKEFLAELLKTGFDPMRGFFKSTRDNLLYPNPSANVLFASLHEGHEIHYEFLGRMLGKAMFEKIMIELPLAGFFLAKLLASKHSSDVDLHNLESLDPVLYKNLVYLKKYKGDVADLNLDFTISNNELGEHEVVELKPGGSKIPVTRENKIEYVHLVADYRLNKQIRAQCAAFKRGLAQLIDLDWLRMFDPKELQILISGAPTMIDIADWRRHTIYANGYSDNSEVINNFWLVVSKFDENQKRKLLKFATSCSLPPLLGFRDLVPQFAIAPSEETRLPTASTCMNLLKLPEIGDEETMRSKLLYAIESNSGFDLS